MISTPVECVTDAFACAIQTQSGKRHASPMVVQQ